MTNGKDSVAMPDNLQGAEGKDKSQSNLLTPRQLQPSNHGHW